MVDVHWSYSVQRHSRFFETVYGVQCQNPQKYMPKLINIAAKLNAGFVDYMRWFATKFIDIRQWYHFAADFDRVLLQLVDILCTQFKYWVSCRQMTFITATFEPLMKRCATFDLLFMNIQWKMACSVEKLNFKVYTAVSVEHISCLNKICRICYVNVLIQMLKVG